MDIRVKSTGKVFFEVEPTLAAILCEAFPASFEPAGKPQTSNVKPAPNSMTPRYFVGTTNSVSAALAVIRRVGAAVDYFSGPAEHIKKTPGWESCPDSVVEQWRRTDEKQRAQVRG